MQYQHNMTCAADYYDAELINAERLKFEAWVEGRGDGEWLKAGRIALFRETTSV